VVAVNHVLIFTLKNCLNINV